LKQVIKGSFVKFDSPKMEIKVESKPQTTTTNTNTNTNTNINTPTPTTNNTTSNANNNNTTTSNNNNNAELIELKKKFDEMQVTMKKLESRNELLQEENDNLNKIIEGLRKRLATM